MVVWLGLGSVYVSSWWLSVSGWVQLILVCVCVHVCVRMRVCLFVCWCDMGMHPFTMYAIFYICIMGFSPV